MFLFLPKSLSLAWMPKEGSESHVPIEREC